MTALRMFIPLTKVDAEQRLVYGLATAETLDRSGEVCDYASTKPNYEKWSGAIAKATDGKSLGNLRAMHGKVAAGKVTSIAFNDDARQIEICAKVVDDAEWKKVQEGVYTGFSQGGSYARKWKDNDGLQRYTADPSEVSLVDLPCLETATFQMIKAAGTAEERRFAESVRVAEPSNDDVAKKAVELAKAAGREKEWADFVGAAREDLKKAALPAPPETPPISDAKGADDGLTPPSPGDGVEQVWKAKDGSTHAKKADALARNAENDAAASVEPGTRKVLDALDDISGRLGITKADGDWTVTSKGKDGKAKSTTHASKDAAVSEAQSRDAGGDTNVVCSGKDGKATAWKSDKADKTVTAESLTKDLYSASRFAQMLAELQGFQSSAEYQAYFNGDQADADMASKLKDWGDQGKALLIAMVQSDAAAIGDADAPMAMAAGAKLSAYQFDALTKAVPDVPSLAAVMEKLGARNSAKDKATIQAMHDHSCDLGATCDADNCDDAGKGAPSGDLAKALADMTAGRDAEKARGDALQKTLDERIMPALDTILKRVENIEKQPLPLPFVGGSVRPVKKSEDVGDLTLSEALTKMRDEDPQAYSLLMIKVAQANPQQMNLVR